MPDPTPNQIDKITTQLDALVSKDAIRDCIYRANRGMDRSDTEMFRSCFHPDATFRWGSVEPKSLEEWSDAAAIVQSSVIRIHHLVGNIVIQVRGDQAVAESYEIGLVTAAKGDATDLIMGCRYVDEFERRDGEWRILSRAKITDWTRAQPAGETLWPNGSLCATRDETDVSVQAFRAFSA